MKKITFKSLIFFIYLFLSIFQIQGYAQKTTTKTLFVSVLDSKSKPVTNLPQSTFVVLENKKAQTITSFDSSEKALSIGILFDVSESFAGKTNAGINLARHGIFEFFKTSNPLNEYFIMGFNDQTRLVTDWTKDEKEIVNGLNQLPELTKNCSIDCSKIYDAFFSAIEKLSKSNHSKRVLLIITDSLDYDSEHSQKDLMKLVREKDVLIYPIIISGYKPQTNRLEREAFMEKLSEMTGGFPSHLLNPSGGISQTVFNKLSVEFNNIFRTIAITLKSQYEITYQLTNNNLNKEDYKIKLELKLPSDLKKQVGKFKLYHRLEYIGEN